jgi:hypothetical protein
MFWNPRGPLVGVSNQALVFPPLGFTTAFNFADVEVIFVAVAETV